MQCKCNIIERVKVRNSGVVFPFFLPQGGKGRGVSRWCANKKSLKHMLSIMPSKFRPLHPCFLMLFFPGKVRSLWRSILVVVAEIERVFGGVIIVLVEIKNLTTHTHTHTQTTTHKHIQTHTTNTHTHTHIHTHKPHANTHIPSSMYVPELTALPT
jgi:hypothetical protein